MITNYYNQVWPHELVDFLTNTGLLLENKYAVRFALVFYVVKGILGVVSLGYTQDHVKQVMNKMNKGLVADEKAKRNNSFDKLVQRRVFSEVV